MAVENVLLGQNVDLSFYVQVKVPVWSHWVRQYCLSVFYNQCLMSLRKCILYKSQCSHTHNATQCLPSTVPLPSVSSGVGPAGVYLL